MESERVLSLQFITELLGKKLLTPLEARIYELSARVTPFVSSLRDSMTETPIILNVHFQAAPGHEKELAAQLHAMVSPSRAEPGCLVYELHLDPEDPAKFMFYEKFASQAALEHHLATPHLQRLQSYLKANNPIASQSVTRWRNFL